MFGAWRSFSDVSQLLFQQGTAKINFTGDAPKETRDRRKKMEVFNISLDREAVWAYKYP